MEICKTKILKTYFTMLLIALGSKLTTPWQHINENEVNIKSHAFTMLDITVNINSNPANKTETQ